MKVHLEAVPGFDDLLDLVVAIEDHTHAAAAAGVCGALPPGEHRLAVEVLHSEVGREGPAGERRRLEPHEVARWVEDHRAVLRRPELGRQEDVTVGRGCRVPGDLERRREQVRSGTEMLNPVASGRNARQRGRWKLGRRMSDQEAECAGRFPDHAQAGDHGHRLAGRKRLGRDEARAPIVRVRLERAGVPAGLRPGHGDRARWRPGRRHGR